MATRSSVPDPHRGVFAVVEVVITDFVVISRCVPLWVAQDDAPRPIRVVAAPPGAVHVGDAHGVAQFEGTVRGQGLLQRLPLQ